MQMGITVETKTMSADEVMKTSKRFRRIYVTIKGETQVVFGMRATPDHIIIGVWGDDINKLELHQLPLDAELTVVL